MKKPDSSIIGQTFNNLKVDRLTDERNSYGRWLYECTCLLCGKKRMATKSNLKRGEIKDCGGHRAYNDIAGTTGVWFDKSRGKWVAEIMLRRKKYLLGRFETKQEAVDARKEAEEQLFLPILEKAKKEE